MFWRAKKIGWCLAVLTTLLGCSPVLGQSQKFTKSDRELAQKMLRDVAADVQKYYYDPKFHGVDWDAQVKEAQRNIDAADSLESAVSDIAALLDTLHDSHTRLIPPPRSSVHDYGFQMEMIGNRCYVVRVRVGSDAEKKGLKPGDEILAVSGMSVSSKTFWKIVYIFNVLRPQTGLRLTLADASSGQRQLDVMASFHLSPLNSYFLKQGVNQRVRDIDDARHAMRARYFDKGDELLVVRIPYFSFSATEADNIIGKMRAHKGVVLDLRGNPGGYADTLDRLVGGMFENNLKIFDIVGRHSTKPQTADGRHHNAFIGRLAVLIDSESESASELFARVIQLEKRGFVVGDHSPGMVMAAKVYPHPISDGSNLFYGSSITDADLVMSDGNTLEHIGVQPDIMILPTAQDLTNRRDPALAKAAALVGAQLTPEEAGAILPYEEDSRFDKPLSLND